MVRNELEEELEEELPPPFLKPKLPPEGLVVAGWLMVVNGGVFAGALRPLPTTLLDVGVVLIADQVGWLEDEGDRSDWPNEPEPLARLSRLPAATCWLVLVVGRTCWADEVPGGEPANQALGELCSRFGFSCCC